MVATRRGDAPWALAFRMYLLLGGGDRGDAGGVPGPVRRRRTATTSCSSLPELPLPEWAAGIRLLGPVAAEQLLGGFYDGLRLATMLVCVGAANALANPKRLLKAVPGALYEVGTAVVVALSVAPQLVESVLRVRRARRLRGGPDRGLRALRSASPCRCWSTRWTGRWRWRRRWTPAATAAPPGCQPDRGPSPAR